MAKKSLTATAARRLALANEPKIDKLTTVVKIQRAVQYYNEEFDSKDFKDWTIEFTADPELKKVDPVWFTSQIGGLSRLALNGLDLPESSKNFVQEKIVFLKSKIVPVNDNRADKVAVDYLGNVLALAESAVDRMDFKFDLISVIQSNNLNQKQVQAVKDFYVRQRDEISNSMKRNADEDLKEGYSSISRADKVSAVKMFDYLIDQTERAMNVQKTTRKSYYKPKKKNVSVQTAKKTEKVSVNKTSEKKVDQIIGAKVVFLYNAKYKQIRMISGDSLDLNRSSIVGHNSAVMKRVHRKLDVVLERLKNDSQAKAVKYFNSLPQTANDSTGRMNKDVDIIRIFR